MTTRRISGGAAQAAEDLAAGTLTQTTTNIESATVTIDDKNIELNSVDSPSDANADGSGITIKGSSDKTIAWTDSTNTFDFNQGISVTSGSIGIGGPPTAALSVESSGSSDSVVRINHNSATGDPFLKLTTDAVNWAVGLDNSDADKFKIASGATPSTNARLTIDTSGDATFSGDVVVTGELDISGGALAFGNGQNAAVDVDAVSGSNTAGKSLTISGGQSTGSGAGGDIIFKAANQGGSGTSVNALANAFVVKAPDANTIVNWIETMASATSLGPDLQISEDSGDDHVDLNINSKGSNSFVVTESQFMVRGGEGAAAEFYIVADEGDDNGDIWKMSATAGGLLDIQSKVSGSYVSMLEIEPSGTAAESLVTVPGLLECKGLIRAVAAKTSSYECAEGDYLIIASGSGTTITLPENADAGTAFKVKRVDGSNNITVSRKTSDTIDGATTYVLDEDYLVAEFTSDGSNWHVTSEGGGGE